MNYNNINVEDVVKGQFKFLVDIVDNYKNWVASLLEENSSLKNELYRTKESLAYFQGKKHGGSE